ncbi:hypothetical protein [Marinobacter xiaoshiensis]|uniref:Pilus assembly protein n=1 Tax=Marinobacter xiaoshiensis TaxID=3073652 RepID=A0ABU2HGI1_9GAMM|nr:hypothetical protein [Marinobacter sp. F60267]MDS1309435.1 hypothetical protein [Marinobacter sp. F60267]
MVKAKLKAAAIHGVITVILALLAALVIYGLWYPKPFAEMSHGTDLFLLIVLVEIVLGPTISLVIFNTRKQKSEMLRDYFIVGMIQFSAFFYGIFSVYISRPVYLVFVKDRIEVVAAVELNNADFTHAGSQFRSLPKLGPSTICVEFPKSPEKKSELLFSALRGMDIQLIPEFYRECREGEIASNAYTRGEFFAIETVDNSIIPESLEGPEFTWLPVVTRFGAWLVFYPNGDVNKPLFVNEDPFSL